MIEGAIYFDLEKDKALQEVVSNERNQLINMMLNEKEAGAKTQGPKQNKKMRFHCDTL